MTFASEKRNTLKIKSNKTIQIYGTKKFMTEEAIRILSAGAPKTGVARCAEQYEKATAQKFSLEFATAPVLRERIIGDEANADIIVAPEKAFTVFRENSKVEQGPGGLLGAVKAAIVIRKNSRAPDLTSGETLKQSILDADGLVYNRASSGQYIEKMIENLGIADAVAEKTVRTPTGAGVMEHLAESNLAFEIGFGQITEIQVQIDKGLDVELVGPLPKEVENITAYHVGLLKAASNNEAAAGLVDFMVSEEGKQIFRSTGVL